jgi:Carboxypeptidase regulatory-like domain/TonB-dependent Receptor Plug Domain
MRKFVAIAAVLVSFCLAMPPAYAQMTAAPASIVGTVSSEGKPVAAARVTVSGTTTASTETDAAGKYAFATLPPGTYTIAVAKGGFDTARESNIYLLAGTSLTIDIRIVASTFSSLQTIASVSTNRNGVFNTSPAAIDVVTSDTFNIQGATQVTQVLDQVPGVQISFPGGSANGASTGAISFPNIRNGLSYETATLIDGHPLAVGAYGDYVTTFLNPALLQSAEIIKGPGAMAPEVNYAINGTVNFRTKDPTPDAVPFFSAGATNTGGAVYSLGVSDTIFNGRLGFVVGLAGYDEVSWLNNAPVYFDPGTGSANLNGVNGYGYGCSGIGGSSATPLLGTNPKTFYSRVYNGCTGLASATVSSEFDSLSELLKLKYKLGNNTWLTGSYFGSQTTSNQSGNTANVIPSIFQPGTTAYTGSLKAGSVVDVLSAAYDGQPQFEQNNEPLWQLELNTSFANDDTLLARFYHGTISRIQYSGNPDPAQPYNQFTNIYGTLPAFAGQVFNGQQQILQEYNYFQAPEIDRLTGYTLDYTHPFSSNNELTASADYTNASSTYSSNDLAFQSPTCYTQSAPGGYCYQTSTTLPTGSGQSFLTFLLRDREQFTSKFSGTFALYENIYHSSYATDCANTVATNTFCLPSGVLGTYSATGISTVPLNFASTTLHHMDPRMGLEWRPHSNLAVRFAMGSSIAPPFLYDVSRPNGAITLPAQGTQPPIATQTINSGNLRPETAWGYDLGADLAWHDGVTFARADVYETNLFGQFLNETYVKGPCSITVCGAPGYILAVSQYTNLANARYEGIELALRRIARRQGFGYVVQGSTQRGYAYNLPSNFYCSFVPSKINGPCKPSTYNENLNIVAGQNYQGEYINNTGSTTSGVSNQSVPYLQGSAQLNYKFRNGAIALFGETLIGKNNSFNEPPFSIAFASINFPINRTLSIQASGSNIFNVYSGLFPVYGGGVTVPLVNGQVAGTVGNVLGPARYTFLLTKTFGGGGDEIRNASRASSH